MCNKLVSAPVTCLLVNPQRQTKKRRRSLLACALSLVLAWGAGSSVRGGLHRNYRFPLDAMERGQHPRRRGQPGGGEHAPGGGGVRLSFSSALLLPLASQEVSC